MLNNSKQLPNSQTGFTLLEIMVVVVILGILATMVAPQILGRADDARITKAKSDIVSLGAALDLYQLDNYVYPTTNQGLEALASKPTDSPEPRNYKKGGYVKSLPNDPWGRPYLFLNPGVKGSSYDLYTLGADGEEGGDDANTANADIGNWRTE